MAKNTPKQVKKKEVRDWYYKIPARHLNEVIKGAIIEINKTSEVQISINCHSLNQHHLEFIFKELGKPNF